MSNPKFKLRKFTYYLSTSDFWLIHFEGKVYGVGKIICGVCTETTTRKFKLPGHTFPATHNVVTGKCVDVQIISRKRKAGLIAIIS